MAGFKRVPLRGSDELFRPTADPNVQPDLVDTPEVQVETSQPGLVMVELSPGEIQTLVEALQVSRYPDRARPRPTMPAFERLGALQDKLRSHLPEE
ncbi:MAG TPA: hypothetical protein VF160_01835 [Candidatus Dormibacteraeota bacterium]